MKRLSAFIAALALLAAIASVVLLLSQPSAVEVTEIPLVVKRGPAEVQAPIERTLIPKGGIYAGVVVDEEGKPVVGATVLLVAYGAEYLDSGQNTNPAEDDELEFDVSDIAIFDYRTAAEARTDAGGRFRVAADAEDRIHVVSAWRRGYMPELVGIQKPREDLRIVLERAGRVEGLVLAEGTNEPVAHAKVSIYLQQRVTAPRGEVGGAALPATGRAALSPFAVAQLWVAKELGSRVWGLDWEGDPALHIWTDKQGRFSFGPVGDEVQLEFVVTHPDYTWQEFDRTAQGHAERTVVGPGESVDRTFYLKKGKSIAGRVVDRDTKKGVADVRIELEHVVPYDQHWWYRIKSRIAVTRKDGSFRMGGLSFGPYIAHLHHPTFGTEHIEGIPENVKDARWEVRSVGALEGRLEGIDPDDSRRSLRLMLEPVGVSSADAARLSEQPKLKGDGFIAAGIKPGRYRAWVQIGQQSSMPEEIEIESLVTTTHTFVLGGGGGFDVWLKDGSGRWLDPATVQLVRIQGGARTPLGRFVPRGGRLVANGVAPGRYELDVQSPRYLPGRSQAFDVVEGAVTRVGTVVAELRAWLRLKDVLAPDGRAPESPVHVELRQGSEGAFRRLMASGGKGIPIQPGFVTVRARGDAGGTFEETYEVKGGETVEVVVQLVE